MRILIALTLTILLICNANAESNEDISIVFVGDVMLANRPGKLIQSGHDPFINFSSFLLKADMSIGNLECVISTKGKPEDKPYTFRARTKALPLLKKYFTAVSLANNHSGDFGKAGFVDMLNLLKTNHVGYFGGGHNLRESHQPFIKNIKGKRIGVLGYDSFFPRSFEAQPDSPGVAWLDEDYVIEGIKNAKINLGVDFLIVFPHWGWERNKVASERQRRMAYLMIDNGADAVVGSHPHVTQDIETYQGKPIFYSLGNFVFDGFKDDLQNTGWFLTLTIKSDNVVNWEIQEAKIKGNGIPKVGKQLQYDEDD